jgi:ATP-dependent helicase/nuclease subunit A
LRQGRLLHTLLQHLPDVPTEARLAAGQRFLGAQEPPLPAGIRAEILGKARAVLDHPDCSDLFAPDSVAEVEIAATLALAGGRTVEVTGRVDRLVVKPDEIVFCDYKSGAAPASLAVTPSANLIQSALYRAALTSLYPGRPVRAFLIWTEGPQVVELPPAMLNEALLAGAPAP